MYITCVHFLIFVAAGSVPIRPKIAWYTSWSELVQVLFPPTNRNPKTSGVVNGKSIPKFEKSSFSISISKPQGCLAIRKVYTSILVFNGRQWKTYLHAKVVKLSNEAEGPYAQGNWIPRWRLPLPNCHFLIGAAGVCEVDDGFCVRIFDILLPFLNFVFRKHRKFSIFFRWFECTN